MPEMDGFSVAEAILKEPDLAGATIMMLTSSDRQGDALRCRQLGVAGYLIKPIKATELQNAIAEALHGEPWTVNRGPSEDIPRSAVNGSRSTVHGPRSNGSARSKSFKILVVEDNLVNQRVVTRDA